VAHATRFTLGFVWQPHSLQTYGCDGINIKRQVDSYDFPLPLMYGVGVSLDTATAIANQD
jgi:hypothetical protein